MDDLDEDGARAPASEAELAFAQRIFDALERLAPDSFLKGDPRHGRMRIAFDGEFNSLILFGSSRSQHWSENLIIANSDFVKAV